MKKTIKSITLTIEIKPGDQQQARSAEILFDHLSRGIHGALEDLHKDNEITTTLNVIADTCEYCGGTGTINGDADDGEGHTMRGVGPERECICKIK